MSDSLRQPRAFTVGGLRLIFDHYHGKRRVIAAWRWHRVWSSRVVWFR